MSYDLGKHIVDHAILGVGSVVGPSGIDLAADYPWTGLHTYSVQDVHNAGVSLGTSGVIASAEADSGGQAGVQINLTATRSTDDVFRITNTADSLNFAMCSPKGEWGFGKFATGSAIYQAGQVLGFTANTTSVTTLTGGVLAIVEHDNSGVTPSFNRGVRGAIGVKTTTGTGDWAGLVGTCYATSDSASFSTRELCGVLGAPGTNGTGDASTSYGLTGGGLSGDWKRISSFRAAYFHAAGSVTNRPKITSAFCGDIPGYSATAANNGEQHGLEILANAATAKTDPLTSAAVTLQFPARGTNKAHEFWAPTAAAAGGPTWGPTTISGTACTGKGGLYFDDGTNQTIGLWEHDGTNWNYLLSSKQIDALGGGAAPTLGTIGGTGPATAGQATWIRVNGPNKTVYWVPAWV